MSSQSQRPRPRTGYPRRKAVTTCQVCRERKKIATTQGQHVSFVKGSEFVAEIERMVDQFFTRVHVKNLILDRQTGKQYCLEYYENGPPFNVGACLVLLVCALGCIALDFASPDSLVQTPENTHRWPSREEPLKMGHCYFVAAEKRLGAAITESSSLAVQRLCLAGIYHMYTINPVAAQAMFHAAGYTLQRLISTGHVHLFNFKFKNHPRKKMGGTVQEPYTSLYSIV